MNKKRLMVGLGGLAACGIIALGLTVDHDVAVQVVSATPSPAAVTDDPATLPTVVLSAAGTPMRATESPSRLIVTAETPMRLEQPFAESLRDTEIDGSLRADANGQLIVDLRVRDFFDYFLATVGEVTPDVAVAEMERLARAHLPESARNQAMQLLAQYLGFKEAALDIAAQPLVAPELQTPEYQLNALEDGLRALRAVRLEHMDPAVVEVFFGLEDAYADYTLQTLRLQQRTDLDDAQRVAMLEAARTQLPDIIQRTEQRLNEDQLRLADIQQVVSNASSPEAAESRLRSMGVREDQISSAVSHLREQAAFDARYAEYAAARDRLRSSGMASADVEQQQAELQTRYFADESSLIQARVRDLSDNLAASQTGSSGDAAEL